MQIQVFEENNRLYVEISEPPKGLKDALVKFTTDGIINALEGLEPKTEALPEITRAQEVDTVSEAKENTAQKTVEAAESDDGFISAASEKANPFVTCTAKVTETKKSYKTMEELAADDDWA